MGFRRPPCWRALELVPALPPPTQAKVPSLMVSAIFDHAQPEGRSRKGRRQRQIHHALYARVSRTGATGSQSDRPSISRTTGSRSDNRRAMPLMFLVGTDPVEVGLVSSLARPSGNRCQRPCCRTVGQESVSNGQPDVASGSKNEPARAVADATDPPCSWAWPKRC
jgi:hypothetical protein